MGDNNNNNNNDNDSDNDDDGRAKPIVSQTLMEVGLGSMYHYSEIVKAWNACGTDKVCRVEKFVHYISSIFGMSQPAKLLKEIITKLTNQAWTNLRGNALWSNDADKYSQGLGLALYGGLDWLLAPCWEWVDVASDCLKGGGDCEDDDIVIWITNMKKGYCGIDEEDFDFEDIDVGEIEEPLDYCSAVWNEAPLLMVSTMIWVLYALSLVIGGNPGPPPQPTVNQNQNQNQNPPVDNQNPGGAGTNGNGTGEGKK